MHAYNHICQRLHTLHDDSLFSRPSQPADYWVRTRAPGEGIAPLRSGFNLHARQIHSRMGQIWRMSCAILNVVDPSWPQTCVLQRPHYWMPLTTIGELPAKWPTTDTAAPPNFGLDCSSIRPAPPHRPVPPASPAAEPWPPCPTCSTPGGPGVRSPAPPASGSLPPASVEPA